MSTATVPVLKSTTILKLFELYVIMILRRRAYSTVLSTVNEVYAVRLYSNQYIHVKPPYVALY